MTQQSSHSHSYAPPAPPTSRSIYNRQLLSIAVVLLLYTASMPFSPCSWLLGPVAGAGAALADHFVDGILILCAMYFQWKVGGIPYPIAIPLHNPFTQSEVYISNGRMRRDTAEKSDKEIVLFYHPNSYWIYLTIETTLLLIAEFGRIEYLRRAIVGVVVAALWVVGWVITPESTKQWAWGHIKQFWFFIMLDQIRAVGWDGGRRWRR